MIGLLWRWTRGPMAAFGWLCLACAAYIHVEMYRETHIPPRFGAHAPASDVARQVAAEIAPPLQRFARESEALFLGEIDGRLERWAARRVYPYVIDAVPAGTEIGVDHALTRFGKMPLGDLASLLVSHGRQKGEAVHFSYHSAVGSPNRP